MAKNHAAEIFRALDRRHFLFAGLVGLSGCGTIARRGQSPDQQSLSATEIESGSTDVYIGDLTGIWGLNRFKIEGVGLVDRLRGTGSDPSPSDARTMLQGEMQSHRVPQPNSLLASDSTSMVRVVAYMPPAIRKGERFDVQVMTMPRSETTSLEHGYVMPARLKQMEVLGGRLKQGSVSALAKGSIVVDSVFEPGDERLDNQGRIFGGAVAMADRPVGLAVQTDSRSIQATTRISRNINSRFHTTDNGGKAGVAEPRNDQVINLVVPLLYKDNVSRYMGVISNIIYRESSDLLTRIDRLEKELLEPSLSARAAMRLEAIGKDAVAALNRGMRAEDIEVQFYAAESLAYLGEANAGKILGRLATEEPAFRWRAMAALATMDDLEAGISLSNLLHVENIETRYGAFRSLHARSPFDPAINRQKLPKADFSYHVIPSTERPMLHFSRSRRAEIVLFGHDQHVNDHFLFVENGLTVKADNGVVKITRFSGDGADERIECSTALDDVIRNLTQLGMGYGELLKVMSKADAGGSLDSQLVIDATPSREHDPESDVSSGELQRFVNGPVPELFKDDDGEGKSHVRQATHEEDYDAVHDEFDREAMEKERPLGEKIKRIFRP